MKTGLRCTGIFIQQQSTVLPNDWSDGMKKGLGVQEYSSNNKTPYFLRLLEL